MLKSLLKNNLFLVMVIIVLAFSLIWPAAGKAVNDLGLLNPLTFVAMFTSGLGLSLNNLKGSLRSFNSILYSVGALFLIFPAVMYLLFLLVGIRDGDIYVGGMILAAQSTTLTSAVVLTMSANANVSLALIITITSNVVSAFLTPVILKVLLSTENQISFNIGEMIIKLVVVLILPVILAQVVKRFIRNFESINPWRKRIANLVVLTFVLTGSSASSAQSTPGKNAATILFVVIFVTVLHVIMLTLSQIYSKAAHIAKENRPAIMFCSSQKTLPASIMVWSNYFSEYTLAPIVIVSYQVVQLFVDSIIVNKINNSHNTRN